MKHRGIMAFEEAQLEAAEAASAEAAVAEQEAADAAVPETAAEAPAEEVEAFGEVEAAHDEVVDHADDIDDAGETAEVIEEVRDNVEAAAETEGGVSEPEARALDVAVEHMLVMIGARREKAKVFPAMEGFADKATRQQSTRIALEAINEKIKSIWAAIVKMLAEVWAKVQAFVQKMLSGVNMLKARAAIVKKIALRKKDAKGGAIKAGNWAAKVSVGGKVPSAQELVHGLAELGTHKFINIDFGQKASLCNAALTTILDQLGKGEEGLKASREAKEKMEADIGEGMDNLPLELPLGGATIVLSQHGSEDAPKGVAASIQAGDFQAPESVEGLSAADAVKVVDAAVANLAKFSKYEKESGDIAAMMKSISAKMNSAISRVKNDEEEQFDRGVVRDMAQAVMIAKGTLGRLSTTLRGYDLLTTKAALDFAAASVMGAGKAAEAPKDDSGEKAGDRLKDVKAADDKADKDAAAKAA